MGRPNSFGVVDDVAADALGSRSCYALRSDCWGLLSGTDCCEADGWSTGSAGAVRCTASVGGDSSRASTAPGVLMRAQSRSVHSRTEHYRCSELTLNVDGICR